MGDGVTTGAVQRFTREWPCPICGGCERDARGAGRRCYGFLGDAGEYAHCTREEYAGGLPQNVESDTYAHRLDGDCDCGTRHDPRPASDNGRRAPREIVAEYDYLDERGRLQYQAVRFRPKGFAQRRPDGNGGWHWNLRGIRRVPYRLPGLLAADPSVPVYVVEGERDCDRLASLGLVATTNSEGAGKWRQEFARYFEGRSVVVLPDNDDKGGGHARQVAECVHRKAASVKVLALPGLPPGGDVSDWLDMGHSAAELAALVDGAPAWTPPAAMSEQPTAYRADRLDDLLDQEDEPLDPIIGDGGEGALLTSDGKGFVAGPTGIGKTNVLLHGSRCFCEATPFLGLPIPVPRRVLYLALEGSPRAMRRRLRKVWDGAPPEARERFYLAHVALNLADEADLIRLDQLLDQVRPDVVIIDPLRNAHPWDENSSQEAAKLTGILDGIIARHHVALILAHHDRKRPPLTKRDTGTDRIRGSTALTGWLQFCISLEADPTGPDRLIAEFVKTRDAETTLDPLSLDFERDTLDFNTSDRAAGAKVSDDAIFTAIFHSGGTVRGPDFIRSFVQGANISERWLRERMRALVKAEQLRDYIAPEDKQTKAKSYALPDQEPVEVEP